MPDQIVPTPVNATTPQVNTGNDQSLDDILNELEKQYNITPPGQEKATAPVAPATPVKPMVASIPTPPPVKPLTEPPKFEVKEHTISTEPKVDKVKPTMTPVIEKTDIVKPVTPVQDKGAGFEALEQTKKTMPNEFDAAPVAKPVEPPKTESVPPMAPPPKKGGITNMAKVLGGVVGVLMLVAGTFAVNKLVTQPQDIRQQASGNCGPNSSPCTPDGWHYFCGSGEQPQKRHCDGSTFCWDSDTEDNGAACSGGQVCRSGSCTDPNPGGTCNAPCPFVQGPGGSGPSTTYYCADGFDCSFSNDANHVCAQRCDKNERVAGVPEDCYARQIDYVSGGYTLIPKTRNDCNPQTANITCASKVVTTANNCTDLTDCSPGQNITGSMVAPGQELVYVLSTTAATGNPQNVTFTDVLPTGIDWVGAGTAGCSYNAGNRTVTCAGGNFTSGQLWGPLFKVKVAANIAAGDHNNTATLTATGVSATTCSANVTTVNSQVISCEYKKAYKGSSCAIEDGCQFNATDEIANNSSVQAGDSIIYRLRTNQFTEQPGTNLRFTDVLDSKLEWDPTFQSTGCTYNSANRTVTCLNEGSLNGIEGQWWAAFKVKIVASASGPIRNTANFTYDQQPGGQTSSCSITVTVPDVPLVCTGLTFSPTVPKLGDNVTITCGDASATHANRYEFGYTTGEAGNDSIPRVWTDVQPAASGSRISMPFAVSTSGTYVMRCRACKDTVCTNWDMN